MVSNGRTEIPIPWVNPLPTRSQCSSTYLFPFQPWGLSLGPSALSGHRVLQNTEFSRDIEPVGNGETEIDKEVEYTHTYTDIYTCIYICMYVCIWKWSESESCLVMSLCDPMYYIVHWILWARILEWVAFPFSRGSFQPRDGNQVSQIAGRFFTSWATREAYVCIYINIYIQRNWLTKLWELESLKSMR